MYKPVLEGRWFRPNTRYADIDWSKFDVAVEAFRGRLEAWYFAPAKLLGDAPDAGFAEAALTCLLIDTLCQYYLGTSSSTGNQFKDFARGQLGLSDPLPSPIRRDPAMQGPNELLDLADVLYHGFRCGILHEAHVPLFGAINGQDTLASFHPNAFTTYLDGTPCLTVVVDPGKLRAHVANWFDHYIERLLNLDAAHDNLRVAFRRKFEMSFGVVV